MVCISAVISKLKDYCGSRSVTYTLKVVISWKLCKIGMLLLQTINEK